MRRSRALIVVVVVAALLGAAGGVGAYLYRNAAGSPLPAARAYLAAWQRGDYAAMQAMVAAPPADFARRHQRLLDPLRVTRASYTPGEPRQPERGRAEVPFTATLELRGLGTWSYQGRLELVREGREWRVAWSPATIHPALREGLRLTRSRQWPERAEILAADGRPLATGTDVIAIGAVPERVRDQRQVVQALVRHVGADAADVQAKLAGDHPPGSFVPLLEVPRAAYERAKPAIYPVPGLAFRERRGRAYLGPPSARVLLGRVAEATAEELKRLGEPYQVGDVVGRSGIEAAFERQLAGQPTGAVVLADAKGTRLQVLHEWPGRPGRPVRTTLDPALQAAGERALARVTKPAALVAVRPSTGEVLAAVNHRSEWNRALLGRYPPGSTFKVVTAAALLQAGVRPTDPVACPAQAEAGGRTFRNFEGERLGRVPFRAAFAHSCNTTFVQLATSRLDGQDLVEAARRFGFEQRLQVGVPAVSGSFPLPQGDQALAMQAIGQGRVVASPLAMASVAAAVASGTWRPPRLIAQEAGGQGAGAQEAQAPRPQPLDPGVARDLRALMRAVVTEGTGTAARSVPGGPVSGKTGTAEFGERPPYPTHAWFIAFRGDLAVAVVVEGGGVGGEVAAPLAAAFLAAAR